MALKEEQDGMVAGNAFDFSDSSSESEDEDGASPRTKKSSTYRQVPTEDPDEERRPRREEDDPRAEPSLSRPRSMRSVAASLPTLSSMDSFILKQLRGWRPLQGASLSAEEWWAILASTNNKLDYESISMALTIHDDQIQSHQVAHHGGPQLFSLDDDGWSWEESSWWDDWEPWAAYAGWWGDREEWPAEFAKIVALSRLLEKRMVIVASFATLLDTTLEIVQTDMHQKVVVSTTTRTTSMMTTSLPSRRARERTKASMEKG